MSMTFLTYEREMEDGISLYGAWSTMGLIIIGNRPKIPPKTKYSPYTEDPVGLRFSEVETILSILREDPEGVSASAYMKGGIFTTGFQSRPSMVQPCITSITAFLENPILTIKERPQGHPDDFVKSVYLDIADLPEIYLASAAKVREVFAKRDKNEK